MGKEQIQRLFGETAGRTAEGVAGMADTAALGMHALMNYPQAGMNWLTGSPQQPMAPGPASLQQYTQQQFGIQPAEQLQSPIARAGATAWQTLGPSMIAPAVGRVGQAAVGLGERGAVGPAAQAAEGAVDVGPRWRSNAVEAVETLPQERLSIEQAKAHMRKYPGASDQLTWMGFDEKFAGKKGTTKSDLRDWVQQQAVQLRETRLGEFKPAQSFGEWAQAHGYGDNASARAAYQQEVQLTGSAQVGQQTKFDPTQHPQYNTPGHKPGTYRELFVTAPDNGVNTTNWTAAQHPHGWSVFDEFGNLVQTELGARDAQEAIQHTARTSNIGKNWKDGHAPYSDIPNPIVRLRYNERVDSAGKPMLFLEEIQPPGKGEFSKMPKWAQGNWQMLGLKRAIREAAEKGIDQVGWTSGEMQAERYNQPLRTYTRVARNSGGEWMAQANGTWHELSENEGRELERLLGPRAETTPLTREEMIKDWEDYAHKHAERYDIGEIARTAQTMRSGEFDDVLADHFGVRTRHLENVRKPLDIDLAKEPLKMTPDLAKRYDKLSSPKGELNRFLKKYGARVEEGEIAEGPRVSHEVSRVPADERWQDNETWAVDRFDGEHPTGRSTFATRAEAEAWAKDADTKVQPKQHKVPFLKITPALKRAALQGMDMSKRNETKDTAVA